MTEKEIDESRERFRPVAYRGAIMYFCVRDFNVVDPMYQYSLQWFTNLFVQVGPERSFSFPADFLMLRSGVFHGQSACIVCVQLVLDDSLRMSLTSGPRRERSTSGGAVLHDLHILRSSPSCYLRNLR